MTDPLTAQAEKIVGEHKALGHDHARLTIEQAEALLAVARDHAHLTEEVRTLRLLVAVNDASRIPDGHTRIDGKLFRLERHGDLNRYGLVRVRPEENPDG